MHSPGCECPYCEWRRWVTYVRRETLVGGWPPKFRPGRQRVSIRDAYLASKLADLLDEDLRKRGL